MDARLFRLTLYSNIEIRRAAIMSAPILRRGAAVVVASAIAGTAGVALAGPAAATPAPKEHRVIVVVERDHQFCRFGHRTVVIVVKKDHGRVIVIRKIVRCDVRRHDDFFFRHHFVKHVKHVEFRRAHRFNVDNNRVHVILPKTPLRVTTPAMPRQMSVRTGPAQVFVHTVPAQSNPVGPSHVSITGGASAGNTITAGTGGNNVGSGASDISVGSGGITPRG
ncbi:hypothetical protein [Streptomyces sp. NPDC056242]|uniref:hypothetical protein n=1 Tax=unclassified Streptomyces TaxID=2593676 RepID=UPI0035DAB1D7